MKTVETNNPEREDEQFQASVLARNEGSSGRGLKYGRPFGQISGEGMRENLNNGRKKTKVGFLVKEVQADRLTDRQEGLFSQKVTPFFPILFSSCLIHHPPFILIFILIPLLFL